MYIAKKVHINAAGALEICACQEAEQVAAESAINSINRKAIFITHSTRKCSFS